LEPFTAAVNQANFGKSGFPTFFEVLLHDAGNVLWRKRVEIDRIFQGDDNGFVKRGSV
jgi:hypothetical protein